MKMLVLLDGSKIAESALGPASRLGSRPGFKDVANWGRTSYWEVVLSPGPKGVEACTTK